MLNNNKGFIECCECCNWREQARNPETHVPGVLTFPVVKENALTTCVYAYPFATLLRLFQLLVFFLSSYLSLPRLNLKFNPVVPFYPFVSFLIYASSFYLFFSLLHFFFF